MNVLLTLFECMEEIVVAILSERMFFKGYLYPAKDFDCSLGFVNDFCGFIADQGYLYLVKEPILSNHIKPI